MGADTPVQEALGERVELRRGGGFAVELEGDAIAEGVSDGRRTSIVSDIDILEDEVSRYANRETKKLTPLARGEGSGRGRAATRPARARTVETVENFMVS